MNVMSIRQVLRQYFIGNAGQASKPEEPSTPSNNDSSDIIIGRGCGGSGKRLYIGGGLHVEQSAPDICSGRSSGKKLYV